jgi:hypothetical protein
MTLGTFFRRVLVRDKRGNTRNGGEQTGALSRISRLSRSVLSWEIAFGTATSGFLGFTNHNSQFDQ